MAGDATHYLQAAASLRRSLEDAAGALARADLERLLECETGIHSALTQLASGRLSEEDRSQLVQEIAAARVALTRCRRLGSALTDFIRLALSAQGFGDEYGRAGKGAGADLRTMHRTA